MVKNIKRILVLTFIICQSSQVFAADKITHYYFSLFASLATGIPMDNSVSMAVGNEMIDRGIWTSPMGLPTPRLLFHFLGTPMEFSVDEGALKRGLALATVKHPLFYNFLDMGLKTKNPVMVGAALHLLIDTFFHAGYSNLLGHGEAGHRPDMPYEEVQKARLCFKAIIELMFIIRDMQSSSPDLSIMKNIIEDVTKNEIYNRKLKEITGARNSDELTKVISKRPDLFAQVLMDHKLVLNAMFTNVEKSDQYWKVAMKEVFKVFKTHGYTSLPDSALVDLAAKFSDVSARTDLDPLQSLKIIIFRILQTQDPVLTAGVNEDLKSVGASLKDFKSEFKQGHFNFAKLGDFNSHEALFSSINADTRANIDHLKLTIANAHIFADMIRKPGAGGQSGILQSSQWSQDAQTKAESFFPDVLSWLRLVSQDGSARLVEDREVGHLVSSQTDMDWMRTLMDYDPDYLKNSLQILERIEANPSLLFRAARLKALAEKSYFMANAALKDMFPGKLSPIKKVVYEDSSYLHACFAEKCRTEAVKNLLAEKANLRVNSEPIGFHTFTMDYVRAALAKIKPREIEKKVDSQMVELDSFVRDYIYEIGFGSKDPKTGKITLPMDRKNLIDISPGLSLAGYGDWHRNSASYVYSVALKFKKPKNAAIAKYIENGLRVKDHVTKVLYESYYSSRPKGLAQSWMDEYGVIDANQKAKDFNVVGVPRILQCSKAYSGK